MVLGSLSIVAMSSWLNAAALAGSTAVGDIQRGQGQVMTYPDEMGIDPLVMQHALTTPPDEIYVMRPAELTRYNFIESA